MRRRTAGSVTLVSLCLTAAMGIAIGSYLALCHRSNQFSTRGLNQDKARELAQTGIEEALWALNQNNWSASGPAGSTSWTTSGANRSATLTYSFSDGASGQVALTVANYASTGPTWPTITAAATFTLPSGEAFGKTLQATTTTAPLFANAIASAEAEVSFVAGGTVDSWNSDPDQNAATAMVPYSFTAGNPVNYNAVVAGRGNGTYGVVLTQATVRGYVSTFGLPVSYSISGSPAGSVVGPATAAGVTIDTTRIGKSAFVPVSPVFTVTPPSINANGQGFFNNLVALLQQILLGNREEYSTAGDLTIDGAPIPLLPLFSTNMTITTPTKITVGGNFAITNAGKITITSTGSLELYVSGTVSIGGLGIVNETQNPKKCAIFCVAGTGGTGVRYTTSANFSGVIYSENTPIDIRENATFYGALLSGQAVKFTNNATAPIFHYDAALRHARFANVSTPYVVQRVTEP